MSAALTNICLRGWILMLVCLDLFVLTLAFTLVVIPYALLSRALRRDPLRLRQWSAARSNWREHSNEPTNSEFFRRQF